MGVSKDRSLCQKASEYYYDLLHGGALPVPEVIRDHVERCSFCREQIRRLGEILSQTERAIPLAAARTQAETVEALSLHFARIGEPVTCTHVRPFLPRLAEPAPLLRIATPITVHVEQCPACAQDLAALRALRLTGDQLRRLSGLYDQCPPRDAAACRRARRVVAALGALATAGLDADLLNHVSTCPACREAVYEQRERRPAAAGRAGEGAFLSCHDVSAVDLFDVAVPYEAPGGGAKGDRTETTAAHLRVCRRCLERLQALHRTIYDIAERADSEIRTVYRTADDAGYPGAATGPACLYPVDVQVLHGEPEPVPTRGDSDAASAPAREHGSAGTRHRSAGKLALTAAAAVVLALLLPMHTRTVSGLDVCTVLKSLGKAPNVHIVAFVRPGAEPLQEIWIARHLNILVLRSGGRCVLYDLARRQKRVLDPNAGVGASVWLDDEEYAGSGRLMAACVGRVLAAVARDARVWPVPGESPDAGDEQAVYELASEKRIGGTILLYRWRFVLDPATRLPQRIEFFSRESGQSAGELTITRTFEYLTEQGMKERITALAGTR